MHKPVQEVWSAAQLKLRALLNPDIYNLWFAPIKAVSHEEHSICLCVANDFCELWLKDNYLGLLQDVLSQAAGVPLQVVFRIGNESEPVVAPSVAVSSPVERTVVKGENLFNPKNTFETFVVGSNNNFSHAAALAVAQSPGKSYNPLFLYGGVGLGKTHLLHAIGQYVATHKKGARVAYVSSEKFTN